AVIFGGFDVHEYTIEDTAARRHVCKLIDDMLAADGKYVAALAVGQVVLVKNGKLEGQRAAFNFIAYELAFDTRVHWDRDRSVVLCGCILTASNSTDAEAFAHKLLRCLSKR